MTAATAKGLAADAMAAGYAVSVVPRGQGDWEVLVEGDVGVDVVAAAAARYGLAAPSVSSVKFV